MPSGVYTHHRRPLSDRFWEKVQKTESCWLWLGAKDEHGYGDIWDPRKGRAVSATHVSWELHTGDKPDQSVLHSCDTPACVRPDHLFLGNQADNMMDASIKGRCRTTPQIGVDNPSAILDETQVRFIRRSKASANELARTYGVTPANIRIIRRRQTWKHVDDEG